MKKNALALATLLLVAMPLVACSQTGAGGSPSSTSGTTADQPSGTKDVKLAYVSMNLANPWSVEVKNGFEAACADMGVKCLTVDSQYKVDKQVSDIENLINDNYSGFTFIPLDPNATHDLIETAKGKGIATASIAQPQDNANLVYTLNEFDYGTAIGTQAGDWAKTALNCKVKVAIVSQDNVAAVIPRGDGVKEAILKSCPDATIVSRQAGDTPEKGMKIIESVLQQHPDLNLVVGTNDSGALGGYQAMVNANAVGDDRAVFSGDATAEALAQIKVPESIYRGTVDVFPYKTGYESAKILYKYVTEGVPAKQELLMFDYGSALKAAVIDGSYEASKKK